MGSFFTLSSSSSSSSSSSPSPPPRARSIKDLPTDIMISVLERLSIVDRVRFGSSCSSFHSIFRAQLHLSSCCSTTTTSSKSSNTSPPWLLLPGESSSTDIAFFSISDGRIYRIPQKDSCCRLFIGSSDGWLVTLDQVQGFSQQLYLLNPITRTKIHLPPLPSSRLLSLESSKAILSWNSSSSSSSSSSYTYTVVLLLSRHSSSSSSTWWPTGLVCTTQEDRGLQAWTPFGRGRREWYTDADIGGEGNSCLYAMQSDGTVEAWDLAGGEGRPSLSTTIVMPKSTSMGFASFTKHLVVVVNSKDGHGHGLLQVWRSREFAKVEFKVFKLEEEEEGWEWVEVKSLDGRALFLNSYCASMSMDCPPEELRSANNNSSIYFHCLTSSSSSSSNNNNMSSSRTAANCCCIDLGSVNSSKNRESMVYRMGDGSVERILLHGSIWEPPPIWIAPTLLGTVDSSAK